MEQSPITWIPGGVGVGVFDIVGNPKIDSGNPERRTWHCKVVSDITSAEQAGQLHLFYGDVGRHWTDAAEEVRRTRIHVEPLKDAHMVIDLEDESGARLTGLRAEFLGTKADFNTARKVEIYKFKLHGVGVGDATTIVGWQGGLVRVTVRMQSVSGRDEITPEVGQVVSGTTATGAVVVGRMTGVDSDTDLVVLDDFSVTYQIAKVASAYTLESTTSQSVEDHLVLYRDQVVEDGGEMSWEAIVEAVAAASAAGEVQKMSGATMYLNSAAVQRAISASALPPEAAGGKG